MRIEKEQRGPWVVLHMRGRLDAATAAEFDAMAETLSGKEAAKLVLDCGDLAYISSAGLRSILFLAKRIHAAKGVLMFCGLSGMVKEVFDISGFTGMFVIRDSVDAACGE